MKLLTIFLSTSKINIEKILINSSSGAFGKNFFLSNHDRENVNDLLHVIGNHIDWGKDDIIMKRVNLELIILEIVIENHKKN